MRDFISIIGFILALEGILFAAAPGLVKRAMAHIASLSNDRFRLNGIISGVTGVLLVWLTRWFL